jgi:processing peptidase subunit alpha
VLEALFSRSKMPRVPLDVPFPGLPALDTQALKTYPTEMTTLQNGLRVVSVNSNQPISSVSAFVDSGSRNETHANNGISHFLEFIAFKSTSERSSFRLVREMLKLGVNAVCSTSREHTVFAADGLSEYTGEMVHTLADVIQNPIFEQSELVEAYAEYVEASKEREGQADLQIMEAIHAAAYHNNTVGLPLYNPSNVKSFTREVLSTHIKNFYSSDRMVLSGVGMEHAELVAMAEKEFGTLAKAASPVAAEKAKYTGGDVRLQRTEEQLAHVAIAFESGGWHSQDLVPMCVLQMMMGGGGSFSAGGPGKGMYSRLYQNVLNQHHWVESANSFNSIFTDSSVFGIYGTTTPEQAGNMVDVLCSEFIKMAGPVDNAELARAKAQLQSSVNMQLEVRSLQVEDIGRQLMTYGKVLTAKELCAQIGAVTNADITRVSANMLKTPPSVAVLGNLNYAPRYDDIAKRFM